MKKRRRPSFYTSKGLYVRIDGEKVCVDSYSFHVPNQIVYGAGFLEDPSIPVRVRGRVKIDIRLAEKAKENFSSFEFNREKYPVHQVTAFDTRRGRELGFFLEDGTEVRMVEVPQRNFRCPLTP